MGASCVLSLRMTTIHGKTKSNQLSRIGLTVVFDEYTGTSFINLKTLNQREYENENTIKYFRTSYPFGNYRIYHTPLTREVYAGY